MKKRISAVFLTAVLTAALLAGCKQSEAKEYADQHRSCIFHIFLHNLTRSNESAKLIPIFLLTLALASLFPLYHYQRIYVANLDSDFKNLLSLPGQV